MEIFFAAINKVILEGELDWTITAEWSQAGDDKGSLLTSFNATEGYWEATLPFITDVDPVSVTWSGFIPSSGNFEMVHDYDVVSPIVPFRRIYKILEYGSTPTDAQKEEAKELERLVRKAVEAFCKQTFNQEKGSISVTSQGNNLLRLPKRLISLSGISPAVSTGYEVTADGWGIVAKDNGIPSIKSDFYGYHYPYGAPDLRNFACPFKSLSTFTITGVWGWKEVPVAVQEGAAILINDYACGDSVYRDRFVASMTAADWRLQFDPAAFIDLGNVKANEILKPYRSFRDWDAV